MITVGDLKKLLSQSQDHIQVRLNIQMGGDARRRRQGPLIDDFRLQWSNHENKSVVAIQGYLEEARVRNER